MKILIHTSKCFFLLLLFYSCANKSQNIKPIVTSISESVYASGSLKSKDQYEAFATVSGIIENIFVSEGDTVNIGTPILSVSNQAQKLNKENAELSARFSDYDANRDRLNEAKQFIEMSKNKMQNDSLLLSRQRNLWQQKVGSKVELEQKELAFENSKTNYLSSTVKYNELKRQLNYTSLQTKKNLKISSTQESDYTVKSKVNGIVYSLPKVKGELINAQTPLAIIGKSNDFILEMQVDEYDIFKITTGLPIAVTMDSYKGKLFDAKVTKIYPMMNERTKSFLIEATFTQPPATLYPNITFEANIIVRTKAKALLIPRNYIINDSMVIKANGDTAIVKSGLRDYQKIEIISGISENDELKKPNQ